VKRGNTTLECYASAVHALSRQNTHSSPERQARALVASLHHTQQQTPPPHHTQARLKLPSSKATAYKLFEAIEYTTGVLSLTGTLANNNMANNTFNNQLSIQLGVQPTTINQGNKDNTIGSWLECPPKAVTDYLVGYNSTSGEYGRWLSTGFSLVSVATDGPYWQTTRLEGPSTALSLGGRPTAASQACLSASAAGPTCATLCARELMRCDPCAMQASAKTYTTLLWAEVQSGNVDERSFISLCTGVNGPNRPRNSCTGSCTTCENGNATSCFYEYSSLSYCGDQGGPGQVAAACALPDYAQDPCNTPIWWKENSGGFLKGYGGLGPCYCTTSKVEQ